MPCNGKSAIAIIAESWESPDHALGERYVTQSIAKIGAVYHILLEEIPTPFRLFCGEVIHTAIADNSKESKYLQLLEIIQKSQYNVSQHFHTLYWLFFITSSTLLLLHTRNSLHLPYGLRGGRNGFVAKE